MVKRRNGERWFRMTKTGEMPVVIAPGSLYYVRNTTPVNPSLDLDDAW